MKKFSRIFTVCLLLFPLWMMAQTRVEGTVVEDKTGVPLGGTTVTNQNTGDVAYADFDGNFTIAVSDEDVLIAQLVGFEDFKLTYSGQAQLNITLFPALQELTEVLVVGYGTTTHRDATGSVVGVTEKDFNDGLNTAPEQLLTGKVAGLQITSGGGAPGSGSEIRIRGGSSLNAVNDPLFVVDGLPLDNGAGVAGTGNPLNFINPSDIESISVLKDASATAIYGARASNGVIIITTKKGRQNQPLKVNFNYSTSINDRIGQVKVFDGDQFREALNQRASQSVIDLLTDENTNWQDEIFHTAIAHDANVGVRGMIGEVLPFRVSMGYTNEDGILKTGNFERTTASVNLSPSFLDGHLEVELNLRGSYEENQFADQGAIGSAVQMDPTKPVYSGNDEYGGYFEWLNSSGNPNPNGTSNPVAMLNLKDDHSYVNRSIGNAKFDYKFHFLPDLKATLNVGYDYAEGKGSTTVPIYARMAYNADNPDNGGTHNIYKQIRRNTLFDFYLNYNKELDQIESRVDLTAGYSYQKFMMDDYSLQQNFNHTNITNDRRTPQDRVLLGFFGRANYTLKDRYLLTATIRRDATSRFSKDTRWGWFPSLALAWNIAEEGFMESVESMNSLKLRLGWGITGQENLGDNPYPYLPIYQTSLNDLAYYPIGNTYVSTLRPGIYDANIKWEEQTTWNIGLDFGFFGNRLRGSVDMYKKETKDMIQTVAAPLPNLNNRILTNIGSMKNQGVEIALGGDVIRNDELTWSVNANATFNENEITRISGASETELYQVGGISGGVGNTIQANMVGLAAQSFYVYQQVYDHNGKPIQGAYVDQNGDGQINDKDLRPFYSPRPSWTLGLSSNLDYKDWDFSFSMRSSLNNYVYNNIASDIGTYEAVRGTNGFLLNMQKDALNTEFNNKEYFSDYYIQNASFLKLDYVTLGYTFRNLFEGMNLRLFGTAQNVFTITDYDGLDPEIAGGIDNNIYPRPRIYSFGVNFNF